MWIVLVVVLAAGLVIASVFILILFFKNKKTEAKLSDLEELLKIINRMIRHNVMGKLTAVRYLLEVTDLHDKKELIEEAHKANLEGIEMINGVKELEEALVPNEKLSPYDLRKTIRSVSEEQGIKTVIKGAGTVHADKALHSVFGSIIQNAKHHAKVDQLLIDISVNHKKVVVKIADKGEGIEEDIRHKIFKEVIKSKETGNIGIGLYIASKTMERYGGSISIEDNEPQGTAFILQFPE